MHPYRSSKTPQNKFGLRYRNFATKTDEYELLYEIHQRKNVYFVKHGFNKNILFLLGKNTVFEMKIFSL